MAVGKTPNPWVWTQCKQRSFARDGILDTHTAEINRGDDTTSAGTVNVIAIVSLGQDTRQAGREKFSLLFYLHCP